MKDLQESQQNGEEHRWAIVCGRDCSAERRFVYAVKTTGVYCRPGCSSRLPRRANVLFFDHAWQAQAAGFRPCKRCRPADHTPRDVPAEAVARVCALIDAADDPRSLEQLARAVGYSTSHLHRLFKRVVGVTPKSYAAMRRVERARARLLEGATVTQAVYEAGYGSAGRFYEQATEVLGMTPAEYRTGGAEQVIRVAVAPTELGFVLVAATAKGICAIDLGDDETALRDGLRRRFTKARLIEGDARFNAWIAAIAAFVRSPHHGLTLPLDVRGTAFQRRVWEALRRVPPGSTTTYSEVAARIGQPKSARAVAGACAANPVALAVPCHRVVRRDGKPTRYRWGAQRKQILLERERADS